MTTSLAEQFWEEGQERVSPEPAGRCSAEADIVYVTGHAEALKLLTRLLTAFR